jgi:hypothetical protein
MLIIWGSFLVWALVGTVAIDDGYLPFEHAAFVGKNKTISVSVYYSRINRRLLENRQHKAN